MRTSISLAGALVLMATGSALAGGGINTDRGDTRSLTFGSVGQVSALEAASQTADAKTAAGVEPLL